MTDLEKNLLFIAPNRIYWQSRKTMTHLTKAEQSVYTHYLGLLEGPAYEEAVENLRAGGYSYDGSNIKKLPSLS